MTNFHTHVQRCKHASGTEEECVIEAISKGFSCLGISDHGPDPHDTIGYRMEWAELSEYINEMSRLKKEYGSKLNIFTGFEYEHTKEFEESFLRRVREMEGVDYFALGQHFFFDNAGRQISSFNVTEPSDLIFYAKSIEDAFKSGLFAFLAHPDVVFMCMKEHCRQADEMIDRVVSAAIEYNIPLEINANGMRRPLLETSNGPRYRYPYRPFWDKAAELGARVIIGSDSHSVSQLCDDMFIGAYSLAEEWGITVQPLTGDDL